MAIQSDKERVTIRCKKEKKERQISFKVEIVPFGDRGKRPMVEAFSFDCEAGMCENYRTCEKAVQSFLDRKSGWEK